MCLVLLMNKMKVIQDGNEETLEIGLLEQDKEGFSLPLSNVKWEIVIIIAYLLGDMWFPLRSWLLPHSLPTKTFGN